MAHWAELDENNVVIRVTVGDNNDPAGDEGYQWLLDNLGGRWVKTSYNSYAGVHWKELEDGERVPSGEPHLRYNYAGIGFTYDEVNDAFIPPEPESEFGESWVLNTDTFIWDMVIPPNGA